MALNYEKIVVTRNHIRTVELEHLNVKPRKRTKTETSIKRVMSQDEKETHYRNRQLKKVEYIRDLLEINFMDMQATFVTLTKIGIVCGGAKLDGENIVVASTALEEKMNNETVVKAENVQQQAEKVVEAIRKEIKAGANTTAAKTEPVKKK